MKPPLIKKVGILNREGMIIGLQ